MRGGEHLNGERSAADLTVYPFLALFLRLAARRADFVKDDVIGRAQNVIGDTAIFASNTSTLPITGLATGVKRQEDFIGIHFFSPVDKMPLMFAAKDRARVLTYLRESELRGAKK